MPHLILLDHNNNEQKEKLGKCRKRQVIEIYAPIKKYFKFNKLLDV